MFQAPQPHSGTVAAPNTLGILLLQPSLGSGQFWPQAVLCARWHCGPQLWSSWLLAQQCCLVSFFCNHTLAPTAPLRATLSPATSFSACASYFETFPLSPPLNHTAPVLCTLVQAWSSTSTL